MGFFSYILNFFRRENSAVNQPTEPESKPLPGPRTGNTSLLFLGGSDTALCISTVYRCVKLLSEMVASMPLQFMRLKGDVFVEDTTSRLHYLLTVQPDSSINAFDFWTQVVRLLLLDGNAYVVPVYSTVTLELERLALCGRGTVSYDSINGTYTVCDMENAIYGVYDEDSILHFKNLSLDGKHGLSTLTYARLTTNIAATGDNETLNRFANGGDVRGIVSNDNSVRGFGEYQDKELSKTANDIDDKFHNGARIVSLPGQVEFNQLSLSSVDMQFLESRKFTVRELCRFFGVHPSFVFDDTSNNYKSAEMANVAFLSTTLNPILRMIEIELLRKLVAPSLCCKRKFIFDRRALNACDLDSRVKYQAQALATGLCTVNELRREENRPPVPGGDKILVSANLRDINESSALVAPAQNETNEEDGNE